jgi:hypothetical protein
MRRSSSRPSDSRFPAAEELGLQPDPEIDAMIKGDYPLLPKPNESYYADWERRLLKM